MKTHIHQPIQPPQTTPEPPPEDPVTERLRQCNAVLSANGCNEIITSERTAIAYLVDVALIEITLDISKGIVPLNVTSFGHLEDFTGKINQYALMSDPNWAWREGEPFDPENHQHDAAMYIHCAVMNNVAHYLRVTANMRIASASPDATIASAESLWADAQPPEKSDPNSNHHAICSTCGSTILPGRMSHHKTWCK